MSVADVVYWCNCTLPRVVLDDESGQEICLKCGGLMPDEDSEMSKLEGFDSDVY